MNTRILAAALMAATVLTAPTSAFASKRDDARSAIAAAQAKIDLIEKNGVIGEAARIQAQARAALETARNRFGHSDEDEALAAAHEASALADRASAIQHDQSIDAARSHQANQDAAAVAQDQAADAQQQAADARAQAADAQADADRAKAEAARARSELADMQMKQTALGATLVLQDVVFETGKADLKPGADAKLRPLAQYLQQNPDVKVRIDGHTDAQGSDASNQQLSQARAEAVKAALGGMGVDGARVEAVGHGEGQPVAGNTTAAGRQQNRRVEITLVGQKVG